MPAFEAERTAVDVVCLGDSLTGWNIFGPTHFWPYPTYPHFLQELCVPLKLRIANGGIAGEISENGPQQVQDYLELFPNARYFVFGMGTNDLGTWPDTGRPARESSATSSDGPDVRDRANSRPFQCSEYERCHVPPVVAKELREIREYHNAQA